MIFVELLGSCCSLSKEPHIWGKNGWILGLFGWFLKGFCSFFHNFNLVEAHFVWKIIDVIFLFFAHFFLIFDFIEVIHVRKKSKIWFFTHLFVTLTSSKLLRLGKKKTSSFVLLSTFRNFVLKHRQNGPQWRAVMWLLWKTITALADYSVHLET